MGIYYNGIGVTLRTHKEEAAHYQAGEGRIVVGKTNVYTQERYTSQQVDELLFFNQTVSASDLFTFYN